VSESVVRRGGLAHDPPATLLSFPFLGFSFACREGDFAPSPPTAFPGPRRVTSTRPDLLLRACLPRPRFLAPIATSAGGVLDAGFPFPAPFRPRRFARPRRLPPPPTLRAYFIPQPRPGFALQGLSLAHSRTSSSLAVALLSLPSVPYPRLLAGSRYLRPPSGLCSVSESVVRRGCLGHDPPAALLSFPFLGFFFVRLEGDFAPSPPTAFLGPRCVVSARPDSLLRARLPRPRFLACRPTFKGLSTRPAEYRGPESVCSGLGYIVAQSRRS
jgi:hypothetical protein